MTFKIIQTGQLDGILPVSSEGMLRYLIENHENYRIQGPVDESAEYGSFFPYPLRLLVTNEQFSEILSRLNADPEIFERKIPLAIEYSPENFLGVVFFKTDRLHDFSINIRGNSIYLDKTHNAAELLSIAGMLSYFPEVEVMTEQFVSVDDNFENLSYSLRRFFIEGILLGLKPSHAFRFLDKINFLDKIMPELTAGKNLSQNKFHKFDIFEHLIRSCDAMEIPDVVLRFSSLLHDIGKVPTRKVKENGEATFYNHEIISAHMLVPIMKRFGIPKSLGLRIKYYVRNHMFHYTDEWTDKAVRRFLRKVTREDLENLIHLRKSDRIGSGKKDPYPRKLQKLMDHIDEVIMRDMELKVTDLEINGHDLMNMGLPAGPSMGKILNELLSQVKNEEIPNQRDILLEKAREIISRISPQILI